VSDGSSDCYATRPPARLAPIGECSRSDPAPSLDALDGPPVRKPRIVETVAIQPRVRGIERHVPVPAARQAGEPAGVRLGMRAQSVVADAVGVVVTIVEACGAAVIAFGAINAFLRFIYLSFRPARAMRAFVQARLISGRYLALRLEFQLASDVPRCRRSDLPRHRRARHHRHDPHRAQLVSRQGNRRRTPPNPHRTGVSKTPLIRRSRHEVRRSHRSDQRPRGLDGISRRCRGRPSDTPVDGCPRRTAGSSPAASVLRLAADPSAAA
jgi:uncharacterized membrane protein